MSARAIMIQGAGSNVGKSLIVAGLCRIAARRGLAVRPFKPQNMSNNAAVTADGGEIGRAQALQARAAGVAPLTDMNPVLLKPESEIGAQVVVQGRRLTTAKARDYAALKPRLLGAVTESFTRLAEGADLVIVEGAGSPAEINLRAGDIANMGFAEAAGVPVVLVGDIDRGGVIAQLVGTHAVLAPGDRARIIGFLVNKFRGDVSLFDEGRREIVSRTGWRDFGVAPWFAASDRLPAEDAVDLGARRPEGRGERQGRGVNEGRGVKIVAPVLGRAANFDDLDPLTLEPQVELQMIRSGAPLPGDADLVLLTGTKSTRADLALLRREGWDVDIAAHVRRGGRVLGLCGGYQMMGRRLSDPEGIEGPAGEEAGLGLLDVETVMTPEKRLAEVAGRHVASGAPLRGYEIHIGRTEGPDRGRPFAELAGAGEGAVSADGRAMGTYLHGLFSADAFRAAFLGGFGAGSDLAYEREVEAALDALADHLAANLDVDALFAAAAGRV